MIAAGSLFGSLAGCLSLSNSELNKGFRSGYSESVLSGTSFEGMDLLVHLVDNHSVSTVNLIDPDGEEYRSSSVEAGQRTVRIPILRIDPGRYEHYTPGNYELVAVMEDGIDILSLEIIPELQIVDVNQHSGHYNRDLGNLEVNVRNTGSGPTWVFAIDYLNPANPRSDIIGDNPGNPELYLEYPHDPIMCVVLPAKQEIFTGRIPPLIFHDPNLCNSSKSELTVIAKSPLAEISQEVSLSYDGSPKRLQEVSLRPKYVCSSIGISSN